jgi:hypothetical protein
MGSLLKRLIKYIYVRNDLPEYFGDEKVLKDRNNASTVYTWLFVLFMGGLFCIAVLCSMIRDYFSVIILAIYVMAFPRFLKKFFEHLYSKAIEIADELDPVSERLQFAFYIKVEKGDECV